MRKFIPLALIAVGFLCGCQGVPRVVLRAQENSVLVEIDGQAFTAYHPGGEERTKPYLFPVFGPGTTMMTRAYPLLDARPGEELDHPHHTGLWFAHGDVNGVDFWHGPSDTHRNGGRIVQSHVLEMKSGPVGRLVTQNRYEGPGGATVCTETREMEFFGTAAGRFIDFTVTIHASRGKVVMGDTKEGTMAIRVPAALRPEGPVGKGTAVTSAGQSGGAAWGTRAKWADYYGVADDVDVGVALFDHPENPVYPCRWVIREYGLFAANPFGLHDFEKQPAGAGAVEIPAGGKMVFRYRFFFHRGSPEAAGVAAEYERFAQRAAGN